MIWIDATPVIHGERAVRRNTTNLISALLLRNMADYGLLYFDRRGNTPGRLVLPAGNRTVEKTCRVPIRLLVPVWERLREPSFERLAGKADLLYAPDLYFPPVRHGKTLSTIRGIAYMKRGDLVDPIQRQILTRAFTYAKKRSNYFLAVSESTQRDLLELTNIPKECIFVVTHGVDPRFKVMAKETAREAVIRRFNLKRPYLFYIGAISLNKNVHGLMDAFVMVASREKNLDLVLAGPDDAASMLVQSKAEAAGLHDCVHLLGPIEQAGSTLTELYNAAEMLVFPSFYEGWCAPPLEAMSCGIPVVCSNVPAVAEVVESAALTIDPEDTEALAHAVQRVLADSNLRNQLVAAGRAHAAKHTWDRAAKRLEAVFSRILGVA